VVALDKPLLFDWCGVIKAGKITYLLAVLELGNREWREV
jgi:hypothetical protein